MKEDNISQIDDYDEPFCEQQYTHESCYISLFKFRLFDQFNTPQTASNFGYLLSCGNIVAGVICYCMVTLDSTRTSIVSSIVINQTKGLKKQADEDSV